MSSVDEYDPNTCVTAGELRARGIPIPDTIPDVGWIPRHGLHLGESEVTVDEKEVAHINVSLTFPYPFRWINMTFDLGEE